MKFALPEFIACLVLSTAIAGATGTVTIVQANGHTDVYRSAEIKVIHGALYVTTQDGKGTIVVNRAACSYQGKVMVCFATGATLVQSGETSPLDFKRGTAYLNNTGDYQSLAMTSTKLAPHSVLISFTTDRGTLLTVDGRIDKVVK
jgi:hypothetical protein